MFFFYDNFMILTLQGFFNHLMEYNGSSINNITFFSNAQELGFKML